MKNVPQDLKLPRPFVLRRLHSLLGLWLVVYLFFHLLVNSQAALFFEDEASAFIASVNKLESLPYLRVIELLILGLPFFVHGLLGIVYALRSKFNDHRTDGSQPSLPQYKRNRAYSWERITAWLLVFAIILHVVQMRFVAYPLELLQSGNNSYMVRLGLDKALPRVAEKVHVELFTKQELRAKQKQLEGLYYQLEQLKSKLAPSEEIKTHDPVLELQLHYEDLKEWLMSAEKRSLGKNEVLAVAKSPGAAMFLVVRETFKSKLMVILYSLFVIAAAYHAFNGLWTLMITWGIALTRRAQKGMRKVTNVLMAVVTLLGLIAIWGTYWTIQFELPYSTSVEEKA